MTVAADTGDFDTVLQDPAAFFVTPQAILDDPSLSHEEMRHLLTEWQRDIDDRRTATGEGMVADLPGINDRDVKLGEAVVAALADLDGRGADDAARASLPLRLWRRLVG